MDQTMNGVHHKVYMSINTVAQTVVDPLLWSRFRVGFRSTLRPTHIEADRSAMRLSLPSATLGRTFVRLL